MLTREKLVNFLDYCSISINDEIISNELIIKTYSKYLIEIYNIEDKKTGLALHTGSKCFDAVSIVFFALFLLLNDSYTPENIISSLNVGDIVIYGRSRAIYCGRNEDGYVQVEQEITNQGYRSILKTIIPPSNFYKIKPYYGESRTLDGRGIRMDSRAKVDFLETVFGKSRVEISSVISNVVVIVCDHELADFVIRGVKIHYDSSKTITLSQLLTASYFTENGEYQYPGNPGRNQPALIFVNTVSLARDYVFSDEGRQIVGVLFLGKNKIDAGFSELSDFINMSRLKNVLITYPIMFDDGELLKTYPKLDVFACTEEMLLSYSLPSKNPGMLTGELDRQISNILNRQVFVIEAETIIFPETYRETLNEIAIIKENAAIDDKLSLFVIQSYSLLKFLTNVVLPIADIEQVIQSGQLNMFSPTTRTAQLGEIAESYSGLLGEKLMSVYVSIDDMLNKLSHINPKRDALLSNLAQLPNDRRVLILASKKVHRDIVSLLLAQSNLKCREIEIETIGRFDYDSFYDVIITTGINTGKRFSMFSQMSSPQIKCLAYTYEIPLYNYIKKIYLKREALLNKLAQKRYDFNMEVIEEDIPPIVSSKIEFDVEKYIEDIETKMALQSVALASLGSGVKAEIIRIATTTEGESIFFTKHYMPYVFNAQQKSIEESNVKSLLSGDMLLFTKNNNQAKDIVDEIIMRMADSNNTINQAFRKSRHWKQKLLEYKEKNDLSFQYLSQEMQEYGTPKHEVTLRAWLNEESHIVGPREQDAFYQIALICNDKEMLADPGSFHDACNAIRSLRIKVLKLIGQNVISSFKDELVENENLMGIIKDGLSELSQIVQIETISNVSDVRISANYANRPLHYE